MSENIKIACFFTAGYTELSAMKQFMKKINARADYIQLCPVREKRSKDEIRNRHLVSARPAQKQNGLTGDKLIDFIDGFIGKSFFGGGEYDAILIEDDKDNRFLNLNEDGSAEISPEEWRRYREAVVSRIHVKCPKIPVIFFLAAPEVEAWFVSDWEHTFGNVYKDTLGVEMNGPFNNRFKLYVNQKILTDKYKDNIESYGYFDGTYRKLSEEIQKAIQDNDFWKSSGLQIDGVKIEYSKRYHGSLMLEQLDPETVQRNCVVFFRDAYWELKNLSD